MKQPDPHPTTHPGFATAPPALPSTPGTGPPLWKQRLKRWLFALLGRDPEAVVVSFLTAEETLALAMVEEVRHLIPDRRHFLVSLEPVGPLAGVEVVLLQPGSWCSLLRQLHSVFRRRRIGMAPVLFTADKRFAPLRLAAFLLAPGRILAYNANLERHHLRLRCLISSLLFWRGVPLDRIHLRPSWLCPWKKDRTTVPASSYCIDGRPPGRLRRRVAILSPYLPWPPGHGGAVRIYSLLREASREFDLYLYCFLESDSAPDWGPLPGFCARIVALPKPRYREPRWSTLLPPEVHEYCSPPMRRLLTRELSQHRIPLLQVEYTQLAPYGGHILVEHDITYDLYRQVFQQSPRLATWWDWWRWRRFETRAIARFQRVVVMSDKDAAMLNRPHVRVIPNGVDLERFQPEPEPAGRRLLFIGSFRHFPNVVAFRWLVEEVWPQLRQQIPDANLTVVAGADALLHWRSHTGMRHLPEVPGLRFLEFVPDVVPLYAETNLVVVPTLVSAGTNIKVLEAMAMRRAIVSTPSGCAGLGLEHGLSAWIAAEPAAFREGIAALLRDTALRERLAGNARRLAEESYSWSAIGRKQAELFRELLPPLFRIRDGSPHDLPAMARIQKLSPEAAHWDPPSYFAYQVRVLEVSGFTAGFLASRQTAPGEREILTLAVDPSHRRQGIGTMLVEDEILRHPGEIFLEVRESNAAARNLYARLGFQPEGVRKGYYVDPPESAIVMRLRTC